MKHLRKKLEKRDIESEQIYHKMGTRNVVTMYLLE